MKVNARTVRSLISRGLGLDFHIAMTLFLRSWGAGAGLITVLALTAILSPVQQGYYFTFGTLIAMQVFFELGLNQVITQVVSHEAAHLKIGANGSVEGNPRSANRLAGLMSLLWRWYFYAAIVFLVVVGVVGYALFSNRGGLSTGEWLPAWLLLVAATCANLRVSPALAVAEGLGHVGQVARLRLVQSVVGYVCLWTILLLGGGLWAVAAVPMAAAICSRVWLRGRERIEKPSNSTHSISWRREILPFQWRIAVSWVSGYFIFNLFTPVIFARHGAVAAGRVGLALTLFTAISTIGLSWVNAKAPAFGRLVARGETDALKQLFRRVTLRSTLFVLVACASLVGGTWLATVEGWSLADRIASPLPLLLMAMATAANAFVYACATYMRSHREEPMLPQSVFSAVTIALTVLLVSDIVPMFALYAGIVVVISVPWTLWLLKGYYRGDRRLTHVPVTTSALD